MVESPDVFTQEGIATISKTSVEIMVINGTFIVHIHPLSHFLNAMQIT